MCDYHVDHWTQAEVVARKWHDCYECEGLIAPGDRYVKTTVIDHGSISVTKAHMACEAIAEEFSTDGEHCRLLGERAEYFIRECGETRAAALLRWMRVKSTLRFARMLGAAWGWS